jgi:PEGA domain
MRFRAILSSALLTACLLSARSGVVWAQVVEPSAADQARAAELKQKGDAAIESMRYGEAVEAYATAYAITKDPVLLYNRGRALQALGDFPGALEALEGFATAASAELKARVPKLAELLAEVRVQVASLVLRCNVPGARVLLRDKVVGTTPLTGPLHFTAGAASLEVVAEGYFPYQKKLDLPGGGVLDLEVTLASKAKVSLLVLRAPVPGTVAIVDGKVVGNPPVEVVVGPGSHKILARADGYLDTETSAVLASGEHKQVDLLLKEKPGITSRWWFWTGLAVAVAGGAVITSALLTERKPSQGDLPPGTVSAPLRF